MRDQFLDTNLSSTINKYHNNRLVETDAVERESDSFLGIVLRALKTELK